MLTRTFLQVGNREIAKMDLEILMQEDRTHITGAVLYSADIFDASTAEGVATHVLVRLCPQPCCVRIVLPGRMPHSACVCITAHVMYFTDMYERYI